MSGNLRWAVIPLGALSVGCRRPGGSLDRKRGPQTIGCLRGWSAHSTPGCLQGNTTRLQTNHVAEKSRGVEVQM